ncbi:MAG: hypothetical protein BWY79_01806 [Actinobacteria bacterium ADurb.Bin444]|nr:MAG: hypothetical protein BWY79_01806 [Actinobacteria bacterium ADurb.Bin444]
MDGFGVNQIGCCVDLGFARVQRAAHQRLKLAAVGFDEKRPFL